MKGDPTFDEIVRSIQIYSGLDENGVKQNIYDWKKQHEEWYVSHFGHFYVDGPDIGAGLDYAAIHYGIPIDLHPDVCELGRRLESDEITALRLRDKGFDIRLKPASL